MRVCLILTILAQLAEISPQNGPVGASRVANGIVSQKMLVYRKDPEKPAWENLEEPTYSWTT